MKYLTIALALIASSRQILAQPARMRIYADTDSPEALAIPAPADVRGAPNIDFDDLSPPSLSPSESSIATKLRIRQTSREKIIARKIAKEKKKRMSQEQVPLQLKEAEEKVVKVCNGRLFAHFEKVSWKTPSPAKDLAVFFNRDGSAYNAWACAQQCQQTTDFTYASVYDNMCEITRLTEDELQLREGGSYQSILPGSCTHNRETYGLDDEVDCEQLCMIDP